MSTLYAEREPEPFGYEVVHEEKDLFSGHTRLITVLNCHVVPAILCDLFCVCPDYPNIKAIGCPLHHEGPGGSGLVINLKQQIKKTR